MNLWKISLNVLLIVSKISCESKKAHVLSVGCFVVGPCDWALGLYDICEN